MSSCKSASIVLCAALVLLAGCEPAEKRDPAAAMSADALMDHVSILSADEFGGRAPASEGETLTIQYLREQFEAAGAKPGNNGSWFQEVPLVEIAVTDSSGFTVRGNDTEMRFEMPDEVVTWTKRVTETSGISDSDMVFVGYGVVAPEYDWNDYEGLDVEGKTVVMLVNDPGYAMPDGELFNGKAMTYYGRWTYKFEEAARQGAAGAIVIHEDAPAGYPWEVVSGSWTGPQFDLVSEDRNMSRTAIEGWITRDVAESIFSAAGKDFDTLKASALSPDFEPVELGLQASTTLENSIRESTSRNVIATIPGKARPDETIIYTAHWDHIGTDPNREGDGIFNGAVDNATGTGGLIELAKAHAALAAQGEPLDRTVVFLAVTAEESGLLGSRHYAENPVYPLDKTVAVINMDSMNVYGPTADVVVVGYGNSELEDYLADAAAKQDRVIVPEEYPERGYYYRSDHFNFAKQGVPALYAESGSDYIGDNAEAAAAHAESYTAERYHKPSDEIQDWFNLDGAVQDLRLYFDIAQELGNSTAFPNWYEGNEFRAIRDASRAGDGAADTAGN